jgi:soluble lytic murein transglycosylase-like protein
MLDSRSKMLTCTLVSSLLFVAISTNSYGAGLCTAKDATLDCLKNNSYELSIKNIDLFWQILDQAASKANKCNDKRATADFLNLIQVSRDGAFAEYYNEHIENLSVSNTRCFLEGLMLLKPFDQDRVIYELYIPTFKEPSEIKSALSKYKNNKKYKRVVDLYMQKYNTKVDPKN